MAPDSRPRVQWSLRDLLVLVLMVGLGLASLRWAGIVGSITMFLSIVLCMALAIVAFVGRHESQAFAHGFLIPVVAYAGILLALLALGSNEFDPYASILPTSRVLGPVFESVTTRTYFDATGKEIKDYDPEKDQQAAGVFGVALSEQPDRLTFMLLGHVLIALVFGYVGAKFAVVVYRRRRHSDAAAQS